MDINHYIIKVMKSLISDINLSINKKYFNSDEEIILNVKFAIDGLIRNMFNEKNWTDAYNKNDTQLKIKYGIKTIKIGIKKREIGKPINSYRKATFFWTRNPKLVNPSEKKRVWVQIIKNFNSYIKLHEDEIIKEFFYFDEILVLKSSELRIGTHNILVDIYATWQKHDYIEEDYIKKRSQEIQIIIN
ncbi:MAG: hypothetical protein OXF28_02175 [Thaumarchaeota archaeon]|nr:hypothetical protein [Nitrososphaerota archaeon]MCY3975924.1 hypothetical protein [Nitrososphaerota archaeon]